MLACLSENELLACLDGQASSEEATRQQEHIDGCPACFALFAALGGADTQRPPGTDDSAKAPVAQPDPFRSPRFQVLRCLGAGGMGVVFEALDRQRKGRVALKTLRSFSADALFRFKREFRSLQDLDHPNLVRYGELFESRGIWFFSMELLVGQDFVRHVRSGRAGGASFDEGRLRAALGQLWQGLSALHRAGKVHRDIKPGNVLCTAQGRLVLLDFGLAADLAPGPQWTESGVVGTIGYMAPEQAAGASAGSAADLYSAGVMLYEVLTGQLPLSGPPLEVLQRKQSEDPPPPRARVPEVPADLDDLCLALLRRDPAARPTAAELLGRSAAHPPPAARPALPGPAAPVFVGRQAELLMLHQAYAASRGGQAVTVVCEGESGIGKSALLARFAQELRSRELEGSGVVVLAGRCYERESVPYKAIDGVLDELSRWLRHLPAAEAAVVVPRHASLLCQVFPVLSRVSALREAPAPARDIADPQERRVRLFQAVRELLTRVAERWPLLLIIDDLHWADEDGRQLLSEAMRTPDEPPLLLLCTQRPGYAPDGERVPGFLHNARPLALSRLSAEEGAQLVQRLQAQAGVTGGCDPHDLAEEAGGHPLFIAELLRHGLPAAGRAHDQSLRLDQALFARIEQLAPEERHLLEHLAVSGTPLLPEALGRALGVDPGEVRERAGRLRGSALIRSAERSGEYVLEMYHDRVREALLQHLPPEVQRDCHRHLAQALVNTPGGDAEVLARHYQAAGEVDLAAQHAERAAEQAFAALAFQHAARLYQMALDLAPQRTDLHTRLGDALASDGRGPQAAEAYLAAAATVPQHQALVLRSRAAEQLVRTGHLGPGLAALHATLEEVGIRLPRTSLWALVSLIFHRILLWLHGLRYRPRDAATIPESDLVRMDICNSSAQVLMHLDPVRGLDLFTRYVLYALRAGEPVRVAYGLLVDARGAAAIGVTGRRRAERAMRLAEPLCAALDRPYLHAYAAFTQGAVSFFAGRFSESQQRFAHSVEILGTQCHGVACELVTMKMMLVWTLYWLGEMGEMDRLVSEALRRARDRGDVLQATLLLWFAGMAALARDDSAGAERLLGETRRAGQHLGFSFPMLYALLHQVSYDLYGGRGEAAHRHVLELWPVFRASAIWHHPMIYGHALELRARGILAGAASAPAPQRPRLLKDVERAVQRLQRMGGGGQPWFTAPAELLRAGIALIRGDTGGAARRYAAAATHLSAADLGLHAAVARRRHGEIVGGAAGQALIAEADAWMTAHGVKNPPRMCDLLAPR